MPEQYCFNCLYFKERGIPCEKGHTTIVPYNVKCGEYKEA